MLLASHLGHISDKHRCTYHLLPSWRVVRSTPRPKDNEGLLMIGMMPTQQRRSWAEKSGHCRMSVDGYLTWESEASQKRRKRYRGVRIDRFAAEARSGLKRALTRGKLNRT